FGVYVRDACGGNAAVSFGVRILTRDQRVGGVPDDLQIRVVQRLQQPRRLLARADVAGVLVLDADGDAMPGRLVGQPAERLHDAVEASFRLNRAPVREDANDARA